VDGVEHHFAVGGVYDGLFLLIDDETRTYWNHVTGEAVHGRLSGRRLEPFGIDITSVAAEVARYPDTVVSLSTHPRAIEMLERRPGKIVVNQLSDGFAATIGEEDPRLPRLEMGLGVVDGSGACFYPHERCRGGVTDEWDGRALHVEPGATEPALVATWTDGERPFQLLSRWYGFALTYPGCRIYGE
jgi:hypothetical protein